MQVVLFLVIGSLLVGYYQERFSRKTVIILGVFIILGIIAYLYVRRVL